MDAEYLYGSADGTILEDYRAPIGTLTVLTEYNENTKKYDVSLYKSKMNPNDNDPIAIHLVLVREMAVDQDEEIELDIDDL